jgi:hypothetical protein
MLSSNADSAFSDAIALHIKDDPDPYIALMARLQLLKNETLRLWRGNSDPKPAARRCVRQVLLVLQELQVLSADHPLFDEIKALATAFAAEASLLAGDALQAERYALEAHWHAERAEMHGFAATVRFQLTNIAIYLDQYDLALEQLAALSNDQSLSENQRDRVRRNRAVVLNFLGEEDAAVEMLDLSNSQDAKFGAALQAISLRFESSSGGLDAFFGLPNTLALQAQCWTQVAEALEMSPNERALRQTKLKQTQALLQEFNQTAIGVNALEAQTMAAFIALELGSPALAVRKSPPLEQLASSSPAVAVLSSAIRTSALCALLPGSAVDLHDALNLLQKTLARMGASGQAHMTRKLQLLTPLALVLYAKLCDTSEFSARLADECLLNLKSRPAEVYGIASLRPTTAANIILEAFGHEDKQSDHLGGGQLDGLTRALRRSFGARTYWFRAVTAAQAAFAVLCLRGHRGNTYLCTATARDLRRRYGFIPTFQQARPHPELHTIYTALTLLEANEITATTAATLLLGEGGRV